MKPVSTFALTQSETKYLSDWMDKVSRSFAIVVRMIEDPLKSYLSIGYLLCRVIDNIEDCAEPDLWKQARYDEVAYLLEHPNKKEKILQTWEALPWSGLTENQKTLMRTASCDPLWQVYYRIPPAERAIMQKWTLVMVAGMRSLENLTEPPNFSKRFGVNVLQTYTDYNTYCYIVAGTVGHLATELAISHYAIQNPAGVSLTSHAEACGRGLQKTNILKDFPTDLRRGISYLSEEWLSMIDFQPLHLGGAPDTWTEMVIVDILNELDDGTEYVLDLPVDAVGYRCASLLCLFPAYQTLFLAAQHRKDLFTQQHVIKIALPVMAECMRDAEKLTIDQEGIAHYSKHWRTEIENLLISAIGNEQ